MFILNVEIYSELSEKLQQIDVALSHGKMKQALLVRKVLALAGVKAVLYHYFEPF